MTVTDRMKRIGVYGISVQDVQQFVGDVSIPDVPDPEAPLYTQPLTVDGVANYIQLVSDEVKGQLFDATRITDDNRIKAMNATIKLAILNGVASYVEAAAHPALDGANAQASYSTILWARYNSALASLQLRIEKWLSEGGATTGEPGVDTYGGTVGNFPLPYWPDYMRF